MIDFRNIFSVLIAIVGLITACTSISSNTITTNDIVEIESGMHSNHPQEGNIHKELTSIAEFETEWENIFISQDPTPQLPGINFEENHIVVLMMESKPTGGYFINDVQLTENVDARIITYTEFEPGEGCMTTQAISRPFQVIAIPKSEKPIEFQSHTEVNDCRD